MIDLDFHAPEPARESAMLHYDASCPFTLSSNSYLCNRQQQLAILRAVSAWASALNFDLNSDVDIERTLSTAPREGNLVSVGMAQVGSKVPSARDTIPNPAHSPGTTDKAS